MNRLLRDKAFRRQPALKLRTVARRASAVQQTHEVLKEGVGAPQGHKY